MSSLSVVKDLDVFEDALFGMPPSFIPFKVNMLGLECMKKRFRDRIIIAISTPAHAGTYTVSTEQALKLLTGVLASTIRVQNHPRLDRSPANGSFECIGDEIRR
jgi:hypothetical protein